MKDTTIQIRIEPEVKKELQKYADKDMRKLADFCRVLLNKALEELKKKK